MPKKEQRAEVNNFTKGLITEASPLNFPGNAAAAIENFEVYRTGELVRRLGISYEEDFEITALPLTLADFSSASKQSFVWEGVGGRVGVDFVVTQVGNRLVIYDAKTIPTSGIGFKGIITIDEFPMTTQYSFTTVEGFLVIASGSPQVVVMEFTNPGFRYDLIRLKTRDVWGMEEVGASEDDPSLRYPTISHQHVYNLYNQSWGIPRKTDGGAVESPLSRYRTDLGQYPSNNEVVWTGLQYQPVSTGTAPFERIYTNLYEELIGSDIKAARGYFIIDALNRGQSRGEVFAVNYSKYPEMQPTIPVLSSDITPGGASLVTEFAGRVFYAGFSGEVIGRDRRSPNLANVVFFSQLIKSKQDFAKCYQEGDPTSRDNADLVDTDGGFLRISGANSIVDIVNLESDLIVIADNGVWSITGGSNYGFSATNIKVSRISSFGGLKGAKTIKEGGRAYYWSADGIYVLAKTQVGDLGSTNITENTIQGFYDNIPLPAKQRVRGVYDPYDKKIRWLYKWGSSFTDLSHTYELILDVSLGAFTVCRVMERSQHDVEIMDSFVGTPYERGVNFNPVIAGPHQVFAGLDIVGVTQPLERGNYRSIHYFIVQSISGVPCFTFGMYQNVKFRDWQNVDNVGVDAEGFILTGAITAGDSVVDKQIPYLVMNFRRTESDLDEAYLPYNPSGCRMRCQWAWASSVASHKWTTPVQVYRDRNTGLVYDPVTGPGKGFDTVISKSKVRGKGPAFSLHLNTEPYKDCHILGWNLTITADAIT